MLQEIFRIDPVGAFEKILEVEKAAEAVSERAKPLLTPRVDTKQQDHSESEVHASVSGHFWGIGFQAGGSHNSSHTGTVASHSENTRSTDFSARYSIDVEATQNPLAEGLARFTQMLASTLEPVDTQAK